MCISIWGFHAIKSKDKHSYMYLGWCYTTISKSLQALSWKHWRTAAKWQQTKPFQHSKYRRLRGKGELVSPSAEISYFIKTLYKLSISWKVSRLKSYPWKYKVSLLIIYCYLGQKKSLRFLVTGLVQKWRGDGFFFFLARLFSFWEVMCMHIYFRAHGLVIIRKGELTN